jgi:hypothetical protein
MALGRVTKRAALTATGEPHPLVAALDAPGRRAEFAAARELVRLQAEAPGSPFPGSSRIVPTLARFLSYQASPRAVVIDNNPNRGGQLSGFLHNLGYDSSLDVVASHGFLAAVASADVELILLSYDIFQRGWTLSDTLANLDADGRTAAVPLFIYGPLNLELERPNLERDHPRLKFLVQPVDSDMLRQELKTLPNALSAAERAAYASEAAALLAQIAKDHKSPLASSLTLAEPALTGALAMPETASSAAIALSEIPDPNAQRSLAALVLDPSHTPELRNRTAALLVHSIQQYGCLVTAEQEAHLASTLSQEEDEGLRTSLLSVFRALGRPAQAPRAQSPAVTGATPPPAPVPVRAPVAPDDRGARQ